MTRSWWMTLAVIVACGGSQAPDDTTPDPVAVPETPAPPPLDPLALMPPDTVGVVTVDFEQLRSSPHYAMVRGWLPLVPDMTPERQEALAAVLDQAELAHLGLVPRASGRSVTLGSIFIKGRFESGSGQRLLLQIADPTAAERMQPVEVEGHPGVGDAEAALVEVEPGAYLVGPFTHIRGPLGAPRRPAAMNDAGVVELQGAFTASGAVSGWLVGKEPVWRSIGYETPIDDALARTIQGVVFSADLSSGIDLTGRARTNAPGEAQALVDEVRRDIDAMTGSLPARAMGLGVIGQGTEVSTEGMDALGRIRIEESDLATLLQRFEGFLRLAAQARG